jgi:hypothetical protein
MSICRRAAARGYLRPLTERGATPVTYKPIDPSIGGDGINPMSCLWLLGSVFVAAFAGPGKRAVVSGVTPRQSFAMRFNRAGD